MANSNAIPMVPEAASLERWKQVLQYSVVGALALFFLYTTFLMYAEGELLYGTAILVFTGLFSFVFLSERAYVWRYVFPGLVGVFVFVIFPIMFTLGLTFTNKSNLNLLSFESAKGYFLKQTFVAEGSQNYDLSIFEENGEYQLVLEDESGALYMTQQAQPLQSDEKSTAQLIAIDAMPLLPEAERKAAVTLRKQLDALVLELPSGESLVKSKLRAYGQVFPLYEEVDDISIRNLETGSVLVADMETGFFRDESGEEATPGFQVNIGFDNYKRVLTDDGMFAPFVQIFTWTMSFSIITVIVTFFMGMVLASFVQWEPIKGRGVYQLLLILPYAVPAFILIMIFRALFNQNFGQINYVMEMLFNVSPAWNSDPNMSRSMILMVNMFLGYPYMFILSLGMLQSIPKDLYEASSLEGAGPITNFMKITFPLVLRPMLPLLIASFAFNFNNFALVQLLTAGQPIIIGSSPQAGETDLLVNYAYRLAFLGKTQDFALAATVSTFIFMLVGIFAVAYLKAAKIEVGIKK